MRLMRSAGWVIVAILFGAATAPAPLPAPSSTPGIKDLSSAELGAVPSPSRFPVDSGVARIRCTASAEGKLSDCRVVAETPPGAGVGDAILARLAAGETLPGLPPGGGTIEVNLSIPLTPEQAAQRTSPAVYTRTDWLTQPTAAQAKAVYPARAMEMGVGGRVTLRCQVAGTGVVHDCTVTSETPRDQYFGNAALRLVPFFRMRPKTVDNVPVAGTVVIPFQFTPPADAPPSSRLCPAPPMLC